jgi:hypothetical protein
MSIDARHRLEDDARQPVVEFDPSGNLACRPALDALRSKADA